MIEIRCLVEGDGEVKAMPALVRKIAAERYQRYDLSIPRPRLVHRDQFRYDTLSSLVDKYRHAEEPETRILVTFDADKDCARAYAEALPSCEGVRLAVAVIEFEAWFLADLGVETCESIRDAKGELKRRLGRYRETQDGPSLVARMDLEHTATHSRSFRHLVKVVGELIQP